MRNLKINSVLLFDSLLALIGSFWSYFIVANQTPISPHFSTVQNIAYKLPSFNILVTLIIIDLTVANLAGRQIFNNVYLNAGLTVLTYLSLISYLSFKFYQTYVFSMILMGVTFTIIGKLIFDLTNFDKWFLPSILGIIISIIFMAITPAKIFSMLISCICCVGLSFIIKNYPAKTRGDLKRTLNSFLKQVRYLG